MGQDSEIPRSREARLVRVLVLVVDNATGVDVQQGQVGEDVLAVIFIRLVLVVVVAGRKLVLISVLERSVGRLDESDVPAFSDPPVVRIVDAVGLAVLAISQHDAFPSFLLKFVAMALLVHERPSSDGPETGEVWFLPEQLCKG